MKPETADAIAAMQEEFARVRAERDALADRLLLATSRLVSMADNLGRIIGERDALARHIEALAAPVTQEEVNDAHAIYGETDELRPVLEVFIAGRQRAGQFKALG